MNRKMPLFYLVSLMALCGCAGNALRRTYTDYSQVYADSVNRQLLLNLARLSHDEPPYFIQLGQMNSQFTFSSSLGFTPTHVRNIPAAAAANATSIAKDTLTLGGNVMAGVNENPTFQFVPLNGEAFAQAVDSPISDKLFYTLFDQGFHADILVRTMVSSVRFSDSNGVYKILVNHPYNETYPDFIRFCTQLYEAQRERKLIVQSTNKPSDQPVLYRNVKLNDALAAIAAGFSVTNSTESNAFYVTASKKSFLLAPGPGKNSLSLFTAAADREALLSGKVEFQMRTFIAAMYAVAREELYFKTCNCKNSGLQITNDTWGYLARPANGSTFTVRPILTLTAFNSEQRSKLAKLVELNYRNQVYTVGDFEDNAEESLSQPSNRSVFSLMSYLFVQNAIDPQKLPVQQLIQVH